MAIDYMIMPLCRYIAGDFVTPQMELSWTQGVPYKQFGPDGVREFPPGVPFGGVEATRRRKEALLDVRTHLAPLFETLPWDEESQAPPRFHRTDPRSLQVFEQHIAAAFKPSLLDRLRGRSRAPAGLGHLFGTIFVPAKLSSAVEIERPLAGVVASIETALSCLGGSWPSEAEFARDTLRAALDDAAALGLPMVVDA